MKFDINNYKGNYAMHCKTAEKAKDFCAYLHSMGKRWSAGTFWHIYGEKTVYYFNDGYFGNIEVACKFYTILEWEDFMNGTFTKADLKTGDVVLFRDGETEICNCELGMFIAENGWDDLDHINNDLTSCLTKDYDIIAVRRPRKKGDCTFKAFKVELGDLVYERTEPVEMTLEEVCKLLGKEIKIVKE